MKHLTKKFSAVVAATVLAATVIAPSASATTRSGVKSCASNSFALIKSGTYSSQDHAHTHRSDSGVTRNYYGSGFTFSSSPSWIKTNWKVETSTNESIQYVTTQCVII